MISRRFFTATLLAVGATSGPAAFADKADTFWERVQQAFGGGNRATEATIKVADSLTKSTVSAADRAPLIEELDELKSALYELHGRRSVFHNDIVNYIADSKAGRISSANRASAWSAVTGDMNDLIQLVGNIQIALEKSTHLRRRMDPEVLAELDKSMVERLALFEQLDDMPAPSAPQEIARLEGIAAASSKLLERSAVLLQSINSARSRLVA